MIYFFQFEKRLGYFESTPKLLRSAHNRFIYHRETEEKWSYYVGTNNDGLRVDSAFSPFLPRLSFAR